MSTEGDLEARVARLEREMAALQRMLAPRDEAEPQNGTHESGGHWEQISGGMRVFLEGSPEEQKAMTVAFRTLRDEGRLHPAPPDGPQAS